MEELAQQIVDSHKPNEGWWKGDSEQRLVEVALTMLEEMDPDTVEECFGTIVAVISAEYGE